MIVTAQTSAPVGRRYSALPEVAHYLRDKHPGLLLTFFHVLRHYGRYEALIAQDETGNWQAKAERTRRAIRSGDTRYDATPSECTDLLVFLFPKLARILAPAA